MNKRIFSLLMILAMVPLVANAVVVSLGQVVYPTVTVASGATTSSVVATGGMSLVGCQMPVAFTSTAISFSASSTLSGTYQELDNSSGKISYTVAQGKFISINPVDFYGVRYFKIVTGSTEAAARSLFCSMKGI